MEPTFLDTLLPYARWAVIGIATFVGLFALVRSRFLPLLRLGAGLRAATDARGEGEGALSPRDALLTAAAMSALPVIAGTATAIAVGGPGAVVWLWLAALVLMGVRALDAALSYRHRGEDGGRGAAAAVAGVFGRRWPAAAAVYGFIGIGAAVLAGGAFAGRAASDAANAMGVPGAAIAIVLGAIGVAVAVLGPARAAVVARYAALVAIAVLLVCAVAAMVAHPERVPRAFGRMFSEVLSGGAPSGAFIGAFLMEAVRGGLALGLASTASPFGAAGTVHAAARHGSARRAALAAAAEPLLSVILPSLLVALPVITSRAWNTPGETSYPLTEAVALSDVAASAREAEDPERLFSNVTRFNEGTSYDRIHFMAGRGMLEDVRITDRGKPADAAFDFERGRLAKVLLPRKHGPGVMLAPAPQGHENGMVIHGRGLRRGAPLVAAAFGEGIPKSLAAPAVLLITVLLAVAALVGWTLFAARIGGAVAESGAARVLTAAVGASAAIGAVGVTPWLVPTAMTLTGLLAVVYGVTLLLGSGEAVRLADGDDA